MKHFRLLSIACIVIGIIILFNTWKDTSESINDLKSMKEHTNQIIENADNAQIVEESSRVIESISQKMDSNDVGLWATIVSFGFYLGITFIVLGVIGFTVLR